VGFVVDKVALWQVFSKYLGFSCPFSFHRLLHIHHLSSGAGAIDQLVVDVPSGLGLTPPQETKKGGADVKNVIPHMEGNVFLIVAEKCFVISDTDVCIFFILTALISRQYEVAYGRPIALLGTEIFTFVMGRNTVEVACVANIIAP
jgi:hypothetical protein